MVTIQLWACIPLACEVLAKLIVQAKEVLAQPIIQTQKALWDALRVINIIKIGSFARCSFY